MAKNTQQNKQLASPPTGSSNDIPVMFDDVETFRNSVASAIDEVAFAGEPWEQDEESFTTTAPNGRSYVRHGVDNLLPYGIMGLIEKDEIMSQNKLFNVLTCYGSGIQFMDTESRLPTTDSAIRRFMMKNNFPHIFLRQCTDMKYFFFTVQVIILSRDGNTITNVKTKDACHVRFGVRNRLGKCTEIYVANWRLGPQSTKDIEVIPLLDETDPYSDLMVRMGKEPGADGKTFERTNKRVFAIVSRFPTPGRSYYPTPYYTSIFRSDWYDIKRMISAGKKAMIKNHASVKYHVEIHRQYWKDLRKTHKVKDEDFPALKEKKKQEIRDFISGIENSGKLWISEYFVGPDGKENHHIKISLIDQGKEGGEWASDIEEASNIICYGDNIHPNLVGATPGKSQSNNSGSDKRELFTLKQSLEKSFHDLMLTPYNLVAMYNGWDDKVYVDVPMITLTTLDKNGDAQVKTTNSNTQLS